MSKHNKNVKDPSKWTLPAGYMGKYEEAKKKARAAEKKRVTLLDGGEETNTEDDWSDSDTDIMGDGRPWSGMQSIEINFFAYFNAELLVGTP